MEELIDSDLINLANNDITLKLFSKNLIMQKFLLKKVYHLAWHIFHSFSVLYPDNPSEAEQSDVKNFLLSMKSNLKLFCSTCGGNNKDIFIESYNIDNAVSSRDNLIQFFCEYHKTINTQYRPDSKSYNYNTDLYDKTYIINRYTQNDYITLIETKYNINLYKLFQIRQLTNFFPIFTDKVRQIVSDKTYDFSINFIKINN